MIPDDDLRHGDAADLTGRRYVYGLRLPHEGREAAIEQMRLMARYRNRLVEIERRRRERGEASLREASPELVSIDAEIAALDGRIEAAVGEIAAANAEARRRTGTPEQREALAGLRAQRRDLYARRKALRADLYADASPLRAALTRIDDESREEVRRSRAENGLYWGSYLVVEAAARSFRRGAPPVFRRWDGGGCVAVQIQLGMSVEEVLAGGDPRLRIVPIADACGRHPTHELWLRIGSQDDRSPIWLRARATLHRPIPSGARIKWAEVHRLMIGPRDEWRLHLVLEGEADAFAPRWRRAESGMVALDLGWRRVATGLRVACWVGDDGERGELVIGDADLRRWNVAPSLRSTRDLHFDSARRILNDWTAQQPADSLPDWFRAATETLGQWRSSPRLRELVERWGRQRFAGDEDIHVAAAEWAGKERHLHQWSAAAEAKAVRWREDLYRCFAARLARRYATAVIEDTDWREVVRRPDSAAAESGDAARLYWRVASPGRIGQMLAERMTLRRVPAQYTTQRCHACGEIERFNAAPRVTHTCSHCGAVWDQDESAATILLAIARGELASGDMVSR